MYSLRVDNTALVEVNVNDLGETIGFSADVTFLTQLEQFRGRLQTIRDKFLEAAKTLPDFGEEDKKLEVIKEMQTGLKSAFEELFGDGACRKVFGAGTRDVYPDIESIQDFLEKLLPIIYEEIDKHAGSDKLSYEQARTVVDDAISKYQTPNVTNFMGSSVR